MLILSQRNEFTNFSTWEIQRSILINKKYTMQSNNKNARQSTKPEKRLNTSLNNYWPIFLKRLSIEKLKEK